MFEQFDLPALQPWIHLVWTAPLVLVACGWGGVQREKTLAIFGFDRARSGPWLRALHRRRWQRAALLAIALLFFAGAAVQPRCNPEQQAYKTSSRDIAILLDVSRSMLATDLQPSRVERAKFELSRLADQLQGDRVGLIVFAGDAVIKCPLTRNYSYFKSVLRTVSTTSVSKGGTAIGDAIRAALGRLLGIETSETLPTDAKVEVGETVMTDEMRGQKEMYADILLITDGEDHNSYPIHAARSAAALNIGIYSVGLGDEKGTPIPIQDENGRSTFLKDRDGNVVMSRLDAATLIEMTNMGRGSFLPVGTKNFDLSQFYQDTIAQDTHNEVIEKQIFWTEIYQPFLLAGFVFYLFYLLLSDRPRQGQLVVPKETEAMIP